MQTLHLIRNTVDRATLPMRESLHPSRGRSPVAQKFAFLVLLRPSAVQAEAILNISYNPTREFYREYNELSSAHWTALGNAPVTVQQSHGGSRSQARAVIYRLDVQVVTLAMSTDIDAIAERIGKIPDNWQEVLPHNSAPYASMIVFDFREGDLKNIRDWSDLLRHDIQVIRSYPKTSGVSRLYSITSLTAFRVRPLATRPSRSEIARRVDKLLKMIQLPDITQRYSNQLSGGQRQRVALARALAVEQRILLLDEPFGALDPKVRKGLWQSLREIHVTAGVTTVFVTYGQVEAMDLADLVFVISMGRIEQFGRPEVFRGSPQTSFARNFIAA